MAHLTGALAGLTIGLLVLKNFEQKLHEQVLWWVALGVYAACTLFAVLFNIFNYWHTWNSVYRVIPHSGNEQWMEDKPLCSKALFFNRADSQLLLKNYTQKTQFYTEIVRDFKNFLP